MPKRFNNRRAREIRAFLETHDFFKASTRGGDVVYARKEYGFTVKIPAKDNKVIPIGTMLYILKFIGKCGIKNAKKTVLKWWKENGYGD